MAVPERGRTTGETDEKSGGSGARQRGGGVTRRRQRLSDAETAERMLRAAAGMVNETGLTVSLEHLSLEEVIRAAGVSRSAVYRRWPYKDLFFADLLRALAEAAEPAAVTHELALGRLRRTALDGLEGFGTPEGRRDLLAALLREGAQRDFEAMSGSPEWRSYLALHATFQSLEDGELRSDVRAALAAAERAFTARIAASYEELATLFGLRPAPGLAGGFTALAALAGATMRGLVLTALAAPEVTAPGAAARPFGTSEAAAWSLPATGVVALALSCLVPDPDVTWDADRLAWVGERLSAAV